MASNTTALRRQRSQVRILSGAPVAPRVRSRPKFRRRLVDAVGAPALVGLGHVGHALCGHLHEHGARLVVSDIDAGRARRAADDFGAEVVAPEDIVEADADVFAPCALGGVIDDETAVRLEAPIVAGSANNQLAEARHGAALAERGILYAPDYVINAGGIINISFEDRGEGAGYDQDQAMKGADRIHDTLLEIFTRADAEGAPTSDIADRMARERIAAARRSGATRD